MRWPFRRGTQGLGAGTAAPAPPSATPVADRPAEPGWTALPPLRASWRPEPPLTTTLQPVATPLTVAPRRSASARPRAEGAPEPGRVVGLAAVVVPRSAQPEPAAELPAYFRNQPPLRHVTPRPLTEHPSLTEATAEYVGEPVAAAPVAPPPPAPQSPFTHSPAPIRADPQVAAATEAGARFQEALANLHKSGHARYEPGGGDEYSPAPPPAASAPSAGPPAGRHAAEAAPPVPGKPAVSEVADRDSSAPLTHRRNTLAQSRRLGLGTPVRPDATQGDGGQPAAPPGPTVSQPADLATALAQAQAEQARLEQAFIDKARADEARADEERAERERHEQEQREAERERREAASARAEPATTTSAEADTTRDDGPPPPPPPAVPAAETPVVRPLGAQPDDGGAPSDPTRPREPLRTAPTVRPITDGTVRPTASAAPLRFRATPRPVEVVVAESAPRAPQRAVVTRPPAELAQALRSSHGVEVADVEVRRDSSVSAEASVRRARAFTRSATVHLPESAGPLTAPQVRGLLAHELVHAAQQRRLGSSLPGEHTPEGRALEAEAVDAELAHGGTPPVLTSGEPLRHAPRPASTSWVEDRLTQHAFDLSSPATPWALNDDQVAVVKYVAQEFMREQINDGSIGGAGGGAGGAGGIGGGSTGPRTAEQINEARTHGTVGSLQAQTPEQFQSQLLGTINMQRAAQHLPLLTALSDDQIREANQQFDAAKLAQAMAGPGKSQGTVTWSAEHGWQEVPGTGTQGGAGSGTSPTIGGHRAGAGGAKGTGGGAKGTGGGAKGTGGGAPGARRGGAGGTGAGQRAGRRAGGAPTGASRAAIAAAAVGAAGSFDPAQVENTGIGSLQAHTYDEFEQQMLGVVNMRLPKDRQKASFTDAERTAIQAQWAAASVAHDDSMVTATIKARGQEIAQQRKEATAAAAGATAAGAGAAGGTAAHGGVHGGAQGGTGEHSGHGSPHNPDQIDVDKIDVEELVTRIYDRVRSRLRLEFLIDRERAGLLTDFR